MSEDTNKYDIAIIGCGPRGLSALESLFINSTESIKIPSVLIVEKSPHPGAGNVYDLDQPNSNWLNVSQRAVGIMHREEAVFKSFTIPAFPDFQEWSGYNKITHPKSEIDSFPLRSELGKYLNERFKSIANILKDQGLLMYIRGEVDNIHVIDHIVKLRVVGGQGYSAKEIALCIGHQPIEFDEQLSKWNKRIQELDECELYTQPYPITRITEASSQLNKKTVAIRGFGLAMIDVVRFLTIGCGGTFQITDIDKRTMLYISSGKEPKSIIPFSLNGLPMIPKPLNETIDNQFLPSKKQLEIYESTILRHIENKEQCSTKFLIEAIVPIVVDKFISMGERTIEHSLSISDIGDLIIKWLLDDEFEHQLIVSIKLDAFVSMQKFIGMSTSHEKVSLDYCIGQVWRHCQPAMYRLLSFAPFSDELIGKIVALDERLKRYSYGPPVDSLSQLAALVEFGILKFSYINNPEIELHEEGWKFSKDYDSITSEIMINSVLDSPQLLKVVSPIMKVLLSNDGVEPIHDKLGARTNENALMTCKNNDKVIPVAMMGRLAKGTLIGVDAIAECFGERSEKWAKEFIERLETGITP